MIIRTKNQIRPRSERIRFDNAEIIAMSADGLVRTLVVDPFPLTIVIDSIVCKTNLVGAYTNIDLSNPMMSIYFEHAFSQDDGIGFIENLSGASSPAKDVVLFGQVFGGTAGLGVNVVQFAQQYDSVIDANGFATIRRSPQFQPPGNLVCVFNNGGSGAFTGGNSANWLEVNVYYYLLNQSA